MEENYQGRSDRLVQLEAIGNALANIERLHNENIELRKKLYQQFDMIVDLQARVKACEEKR